MQISSPAWQRVFAMLLCLVFVCAFYGSLTVQAVFGVDDIVIGGTLVASAAVLTYITVVGLSGSDLAQPLYDAANRANTDINDWLEPKVTAFLQATDGATLLDMQIKSLVKGLSYGKNGVLYFSDALGTFIHDFGEWLIDNGDIVLPAADSGYLDVLPSGVSSLPNGYNLPVSVNYTNVGTVQFDGSRYYTIKTSSTCMYVLFTQSSSWNLVALSKESFNVGSGQSLDPTINSSSLSLSYNGEPVYYYQAVGSAFSSSALSGNSLASGVTRLHNLSTNDFSKLVYALLYGATSTGDSSGLDVWNQDTTDGFAVDPSSVIGGSIGAADVPAGAIAGIGDYVQAIADAIAGIADITLPVAGVGDIPIDPAIPADISIPVTPAIPADVADAVPATGEATPAYPATGDYTLPLADFFPFCIPFDLYKMLSLLSASPQAPAFTWQFYTPGGGSIPIEVDLSAFDSVAAVLRAVETLAFCVGLGFVTKKLLFGS